MTGTEITEILVSIARLEGKLDAWAADQKDHEKRIRSLESSTIQADKVASNAARIKDLETAVAYEDKVYDMIESAREDLINHVASMAKLTWTDIGKLVAGIGSLLTIMVFFGQHF